MSDGLGGSDIMGSGCVRVCELIEDGQDVII